MRFGIHFYQAFRRMTFGFFLLLDTRLRCSQIRCNGGEHQRCMVTQCQLAHTVTRDFQGTGKVLPALQDGFSVLGDKV